MVGILRKREMKMYQMREIANLMRRKQSDEGLLEGEGSLPEGEGPPEGEEGPPEGEGPQKVEKGPALGPDDEALSSEQELPRKKHSNKL